MSRSTDGAWNGAVQLGVKNRETIELARRHCLNMEFVHSGGRGAVEAATGLPINMRQVRCQIAHGHMAMNLGVIAADFYHEHCVGCALRRPTGDVPNLATVLEGEAAEVAEQAAQEAERLSQAQAAWARRDEYRRATAAQSDQIMASALADIGLLDTRPGGSGAPIESEAARARLLALAERTPGAFTADVVSHAVELVEILHVAPDLLVPLRRLAGSRAEFAPEVARAAVAALRRGPAAWAGPCIAELIDHVSVASIDDRVCVSLVHLAGAPLHDALRRSVPGRTNDPTGLRAVADVAPHLLQRVLDGMLPRPSEPVDLLLPSGTPFRRETSKFDQAAAAGAIRALASTHPDLAGSLADALVRAMTVPPGDEQDYFGDRSAWAVPRALAVLLVLGVGDVLTAVERAGRYGGKETRSHLARIYSLAADLVSPEPRSREPGDPRPDPDRRREVAGLLFDAAAARVGGDWGDDERTDSAQQIEDLARQDPMAMLPRLPALLGTVLGLLDARSEPPSSPLDVVDDDPPTLRMLRGFGRRSAIGSAISRVLRAVEAVAAADATAVCSAINDVIRDERDNERGHDVTWWLLRTLGTVGDRHGDEPAVLRTILPTLHSYLVDVDPGLRARALDAWAAVASSHDLPSSLVDLLPVLTTDTHVVVAFAVTRAASRLDWPENAKETLLMHAFALLAGIDPANEPDGAMDAIRTVMSISRQVWDTRRRLAAERYVLHVAEKLDGHSLERLLSHAWLPDTARSLPMARLRLRQAADPEINDRWNANDAPELCALLRCGPGLVDLPLDHLVEAALALAPDYPLAAAEFAEVAWRAGRPRDAATVMEAVLTATPDQPAFTERRRLSELIRAAAQADAAIMTSADATVAVGRRTVIPPALAADSSSLVQKLVAHVTTVATVRRLLTSDPEAGQLADPAEVRRARADALSAAGKTLAETSEQATDTGAYLRAVAATCEVGSHLLCADAAGLAADTAAMSAHTTAAVRRAQLVADELERSFGPADPLAGPLTTSLARIGDLPYDSTRDRVTDYPVFDERLLSLYDQLTRSGYDANQLQAFCRLLTAVCRAGLRMTWDKRYRRGTKVSERTFHDDLHTHLLADPELGGRVERGSPLALGYLDVRHDGITAELKVERKVPVTKASAPKYIGQPTQYAAADGARLSILAILDMSPKILPIGTPENYLFTLVPELHGLDNPESPSLVAVLIVNGNVGTPSSYSRRKTPTVDGADTQGDIPEGV